MKVQPKNADAFSKRPPGATRLILLYGPDAGLVRERAKMAAQSACPDLSDPFRVTEMKADQVTGDAARLGDELSAIALTGGRRVVRLRDADDKLAPVVTTLLKDFPPGDTLLVMEAGELDARSKLRKAVEDAGEIAGAIACYVEGEEELAGTIGRMMVDHGLQIDPDARDWLAGNLVGDRSTARGEIDKLALYMLGEKRVTLEDARTVIGDSAALDMDEPAQAAASGDMAELDRSLRRLYADGTATVAILRAAQRYFQRLHMAVAHVAKGQTPQAAVKALRPPVFFKLEPVLTAQIRNWTLPKLHQALDRLQEAEAECKRTHMPDETICSRAFFQLAQLARRPN
ncbi:DNA polymerase III subunit delta [Niveispirillum lacus]|uniref:DNA-directed DNA polymerase n=1 Tax=Niveispirillum lacus TaxID=1981099 RepID=A0A255Z143_9PROT|nr:DNA polymerase III subunit delta [Niveispirillum lacus]OYQ35172.1 DNA polymerase III subunit delta [Niveispirillum lacus]